MTGSRRFVLALLALLACAVASAFALGAALSASGLSTATAPLPSWPADAAAAPEDAAARLAERRRRAGSWLETALSRPLFDPRRRPAPAAAAGESAPPAARGLPRLAGVVVGDFGASAIFEAAGVGKPMVLREGDWIDGYVVRSILPGEATLQGPEGRQVLRPSFSPDDRAERASPNAATMPFSGASAPRGSARSN